MNCRGTAPPTTLSTNSNPAPSGSGSTSMSQTAYWPCPPDCFTCRPWPFALPPNVSRSGTRSSTRVHGDAVAVGQRVEHDARVRLAHAPEHDLVGLRVLLDPQRRVFGGQPLQPDRQLVLVGLGVRLHGDRQQRLGHRPRLEHAAVRTCRTACRRFRRGSAGRSRRCRPPPPTGAGRCCLPSGNDSVPMRSSSSWSAWLRSSRGRPEEGREMARHVNRRVGPDGAGEHPDQADPADVRVRRRLHHLGEQRPVRVAGQAVARLRPAA